MPYTLGRRITAGLRDMPLRADDHYVLEKLNRDLLPMMVIGRRAKRQWFVRLATVNSLGGEVVGALAGLGIGGPFLQLFDGKNSATKTAAQVISETFAGIWIYAALVLLVVWIIFRKTLETQKIALRAAHAQECTEAMRGLFRDLDGILNQAKPLPEIDNLASRARQIMNDAHARHAWPFEALIPHPFPHVEQIDLDQEIDHIRHAHMAKWEVPTQSLEVRQ